ncbi:MAG: AMP-binding protein [bacterium]|nr:AMP-binding protein [bacterium]
MNILLKIKEIAEKQPDKLFATMIEPNQEIHISYKDFFHKVRVTGCCLQQKHAITKGDVIIIILKPSLDLLISFIACMSLSAIPTIIAFPNEKMDMDFYKAKINDLLKFTKGRMIITYPELSADLGSLLDLPVYLKKIMDISEITDPSDPEDCPDPTGPSYNIPPEQIALLQHSSGTTGYQKGVALSHQAILKQIQSLSHALDLDQDDVIVSWLPLYHDMGLIGCFLLPLLTGTRLVMMSPFYWVNNPVVLLQAITRYRGTLCFLPNFSYNFMANPEKLPDDLLKGIDLESMRAFINCSEPIKKKSHEKFYKRFKAYHFKRSGLCVSYALAENTFAATIGGIREKVREERIDLGKLLVKRKARLTKSRTNSKVFVSSGKPVQDTHIRIIRKDGRNAPDRDVGEITLKSPYMLDGYYHRPDVTRKSFLHGWYLTGDVGYKVKDHLFVIARKKDIIIVGGKNIYPEDIELTISEIKGVYPGRVVVLGVFDDEEGTEKIVVIAEIKDGADKGGIKKRIRRIVVQETGYNVGDVYLTGKKWLLKTSSGKISREANKRKYLKILHKENLITE